MKPFILNNIDNYFIIKNNTQKIIKIFDIKISPSSSINLLNFGISENIIESSLSKGDLKSRILKKDISVVAYNLFFKYDFHDLLKAEKSINNQDVWYLDPINGNDTLAGNSISSAIKTQREWYKRTNGEITNNTVIVLLNDLKEDLIWNIKCQEPNLSLTIQGALIPIFSTVISSATYWNPDLNIEGTIKIDSMPKSFKESNLIGKLCKIKSGPREGVAFWICNEKNKNTAVISPAFHDLLNEEEQVLQPQAGDIVTFYDFVELSSKQQIECNNLSFTLNIKNLNIKNIQCNVLNVFSSCCKISELTSIPHSKVYGFCNYYNELSVSNLLYYVIFNSVINGDSKISYSNLEFINNMMQNGTLYLKNKAFIDLKKWCIVFKLNSSIYIEESSLIKNYLIFKKM